MNKSMTVVINISIFIIVTMVDLTSVCFCTLVELWNRTNLSLNFLSLNTQTTHSIGRDRLRRRTFSHFLIQPQLIVAAPVEVSVIDKHWQWQRTESLHLSASLSSCYDFYLPVLFHLLLFVTLKALSWPLFQFSLLVFILSPFIIRHCLHPSVYLLSVELDTE